MKWFSRCARFLLTLAVSFRCKILLSVQFNFIHLQIISTPKSFYMKLHYKIISDLLLSKNALIVCRKINSSYPLNALKTEKIIFVRFRLLLIFSKQFSLYTTNENEAAYAHAHNFFYTCL